MHNFEGTCGASCHLFVPAELTKVLAYFSTSRQLRQKWTLRYLDGGTLCKSTDHYSFERSVRYNFNMRTSNIAPHSMPTCQSIAIYKMAFSYLQKCPPFTDAKKSSSPPRLHLTHKSSQTFQTSLHASEHVPGTLQADNYLQDHSRNPEEQQCHH